jgi:protein SCO1/2
MTMPISRHLLLSLSLAATVGLSAVAWANWMAQPRTEVNVEGAAAEAAYARLGRGLENVTLTDRNGARTKWADLNGRPRVMFFGFTHCPNVCPMTMTALQAAMDEAGIRETALHIDFVTLDPARDTPIYLNDYLSGFGPGVRGFTGEMADLTRVAQAFRAAFTRTDLGGADYTIDHTTGVYFINAEGRVVSVVNYDADPADLTRALRALLDAPV